jgi:hypothetical protein
MVLYVRRTGILAYPCPLLLRVVCSDNETTNTVSFTLTF